MFSHCKRSLFVRRLLVTPAALVALAAGGDERLGADEDPAVIPERYITIADEALNIDSVATYAVEGGVRLAATAKSGHLLRVYDAATGALIDDVGGPGDGPGEFRRPNGIFAIDDMLIVVERDNRRVQVLGLPSLAPLGTFGDDELVYPYGLFVHALGDDRYGVYVTDAYENEDGSVPPFGELDRRVHAFELTAARDGASVTEIRAEHRAAFGATEGDGVLHVVESIWGDPENDRLMIAEEEPAGGRVIKVYTFAGRFADRIVGDGIFVEQPEGIALYACNDGSGYWVTTDQLRTFSVFHLFDRRTLRHAGAFRGEVTANTDGIWLHAESFDGFPAGALYAVHDDQAVSAFDFGEVLGTLGLEPCR